MINTNLSGTEDEIRRSKLRPAARHTPASRSTMNSPSRAALEERDWYSSSRDLVSGLVVRELTGTSFADLFHLT